MLVEVCIPSCVRPLCCLMLDYVFGLLFVQVQLYNLYFNCTFLLSPCYSYGDDFMVLLCDCRHGCKQIELHAIWFVSSRILFDYCQVELNLERLKFSFWFEFELLVSWLSEKPLIISNCVYIFKILLINLEHEIINNWSLLISLIFFHYWYEYS